MMVTAPPPSQLTESLRDRYAIEHELGRGGMATVYLVRDLRHRRSVALKVMRPELSGSLGVERFLREIELAANLQHPHILPVFDSGVVEYRAGESVPYFVMPYVEGETLRCRLQRDRRLPVDQAMQVAGEVADALAYAHLHGVVHRDIKPENILLSGDHAMVADFGVARALASGVEGTSTRLTQAGLAIGTPNYMSPEQATGRDVIDGRADQYSLGCVLFEMLTGEPPFGGDTPRSIMAQSLTASRPRPSRARSEVPAGLDMVVTRALAVDPAERFPEMSAFAAALRSVRRERSGTRPLRGSLAALVLVIAAGLALGGTWLVRRSAAGSVAPAAEEIAVLPFSTSGAGVEHLQEGMVDLLSANLDGVGGIRTVDPRSAVQRWDKASGVGLERARAVGRELHAGSVITGSAVAAGGRVRLSADLRGVGGERLGHAQVEGAADSILRLVDRLSLALLREVWRGREPLPSLDIGTLTTESPEALRAYLEGERHYRRNQLDSALADFNRALELDSTFAWAHFARSEVYGWKERYGAESEQRAFALGVRYAGRLPPRLRLLLSARQLFQAGRPEAVDSARKYVKANPRSLDGWYLLGEALYHSREHTPVSPDTIRAAFDSVLALDSARVPATLHPITLTLVYRDSVAYQRYLGVLRAAAPAAMVSVGLAAREVTWGSPSDSAIRALAVVPQPTWAVLLSFYRRPNATSDTVVQAFSRVEALAPRGSESQRQAVLGRALALAGLGRLAEAQQMADTVARVAPSDLGQALGRPILAALAPPGFGGPRFDSIVRSLPDDPERPFLLTLWDLARGRSDDARRRAEAALAVQDTIRVPPRVRGMLTTALGWADLQAGDSSRGIERLRRGLTATPAPLFGPMDAPRFQLALALSSRPETRNEGIRWLRYGFEDNPIYLPLTCLALGRAYEAAGEPDSAALAYGRFVRLWDKADPTLQGRVQEAREALQRLTAEPRAR